MNIGTEIKLFLARTKFKPNHLAKAAGIRVGYITRVLNDPQKDMRSSNADLVRKAMQTLDETIPAAEAISQTRLRGDGTTREPQHAC
ncbi:MAG: hypothetical protein RDU24_08970 [Humidesulfovibrio sp.]|uniref:hypothetical protein n=1 Tax=Humidesulfovibrio sp. TaxID=2910988 RepID=UPI0027F99295|nr:hypothetical protein [Humidesulfovibrio sp.]MDQ7835500.1 hypothetical protein [Humidesulfovibrio sp.]